VADLTLQVSRGEIFGFLGPNGAGKSTAVKMLLGLVIPSGGAARVLGQPPGDTRALSRIGFLPEHFRFHEWLRASEFLDLHGDLYGLDRAKRRCQLPALLERVGLAEHADRPLSAFSKGMLQRIGLAQALLAEPDLVFLDEPTSALDPLGRRLVRGVLRDLKERGATVFLNSHLLGEVEATCDRVCFIKGGRVLRTLALAELRGDQVQVELHVDAVTPALLSALGRLPVEFCSDPLPDRGGGVGARLELTAPDEECLPAIAECVVASGTRLYALVPRQASLEQTFLDIIGTEDSGQ
jgi:ABC-2 type transport system ATP-binding protein